MQNQRDIMEKHYDHLSAEKSIQEKWDQQNTYARERHAGPVWSVDTPPPTVSGSLHIGHIFSYTQTDIIARYKRMSGFSVFYPFGFDDNGLPTERYVEKKRDVSAHALGRSKFIELCLQETQDVEKQFKNLWQRIGLSVDWNACYSTIDTQTRSISQRSFIELLKKGYVYRRYEPALYCTTCRTSVAQAELDDALVPSLFNDILFKDSDGNDVVISTTRPELLPSCVALFFHPDDVRYKHLKGKHATVPLFDVVVPFLSDATVQMDKGTGLVMCCTFGDKTDIMWYKKHALDYKQSIGFDGKFVAKTGELAGLKVPQARQKVLELLQAKGLLLKQKAIEHNVSVHERCKKEIEYVMLAQWFLNVLDHKKELVALADQINWYPTFMKSRYINWVQNLSWDWCLSRQRLFGIPFPVWHVKDTNEFLVPPVQSLPVDPQEQAFPGEIPVQYKGCELIGDTDVMDTWNTSSLTPYLCFAQYGKKDTFAFDDPELMKFLPMSMRPQAHDIIRTWAFYTIVKTWMHTKQIPWNNIVISGHVLADSKEKLSKSKEHKALSPEHLLSTHSADVIRYWTASGNLGHDVAFSDTQLKIGGKLITKLWNALKFVKEHVNQKNSDSAPEKLGVINEWVLHELTQSWQRYNAYFEHYEFGLALAAVEQFFWQVFCDNYLELIKDQLFNPDGYDHDQLFATRWTLHHVGKRILQLFAPYMPFVTEYMYGLLYASDERDSVHTTKFAHLQTMFNFEQSSKTMQYVLHIVGQVRKLKTEHQLSLRTELATLTIGNVNSDVQKILQMQEQLIKGATKSHKLCYTDAEIIQELCVADTQSSAHVNLVIES